MRHTLKLYFMNSSTYPNPIPSEAPVITTHPSPYFALRSCLKERRFFFTHDSKEKENLVKRGNYVNLSYANALQSLVNSKDVLPLYIAKDVKGLNLTINEISKIIDYQNKGKINVDGFSNFASESREVLGFSEIKNKYCEVILSPLMQDCLFAVTQKMEDKIREENKTTKLTAEEINQKCEEATNKIIQNFLQIDTNKWQEDILNNNGYDFSITEMNLIHYLYQNNDTLIHLVKSFFEKHPDLTRLL